MGAVFALRLTKLFHCIQVVFLFSFFNRHGCCLCYQESLGTTQCDRCSFFLINKTLMQNGADMVVDEGNETPN